MLSLAPTVYRCNVTKKLLLVALYKKIQLSKKINKNNVVISYLAGYNMTGADRKDLNSSVLTYHRIVEAFKFAYAYRALLGDEDFWDVEEVSPLCMDTEKCLQQ